MSDALSPDDLITLNRLTTVARVLAGTAHDVNNALQIIAGSAEMLGQRPDLPEPARRAIQRIQAQTTRAAETVTRVMHFARAEQDAVARISMRGLIERAIALRAYPVRRAGLALDFDAAQAPAGFVRGRGALLIQAVVNLIMNAEQAMTGRQGGHITLTLTEPAGQVVLSVADTGGGLAPAVAETLFDPFVTSHPVPDTAGLGLAAARLIARQHDGDVSLASDAAGCRATLWLPAAA